MAKNLKLTIKNTQLAEALKLGKTKSLSEKEKKKKPLTTETQTAASQEKESSIAAHPIPEVTTAPAEPSKSEEVATPQAIETPPPPPAPPPEVTPAEKTGNTAAPPSAYRPKESTPTQHSRPYQSQYPSRRPPYSSPGSGQTRFGPRPPYQQRPFSSSPRPPPRPGQDRPMSPRPGVPPSPGKAAHETRSAPADKGIRKGPAKEYRDLKPQRKVPLNKGFDSRDRQGLRDTESEEWRKKRPNAKFQYEQEEVILRPKQLKVRLPITLKDLASEMKLKSSELVSKLFMQGVILTLNDYLTDETTLQLLGQEFDCEITVDTSEEDRLRITDKTIKQEVENTPSDLLTLRPPVVAFMGHVDHGKTSLIDAIRKTNIASTEAGAITQHIGAFRCHTAVGDLTILDTPGHEAFSAMRSRGADITDIIVLVIAGDEGIKEQTLEAIKQAQEAKVPIVVAINKCDKDGFNAENIYRQLTERELLPEAWGGTTITVNCSAFNGTGIKELLEMLALQAEVLELRANPKARARGAVIESEMHKGLGAVAAVLVQNGTLHLGDALVFGEHWARVKTMHDEQGRELKDAPPSTPIKITGLSGIPEAGSEFIVVKSEREARDLAYERSQGQRHILSLQPKKKTLESMLQHEATRSERKTLNLLLKADVQGSLEALRTSLQKLPQSKVEVHVISAGVGEISESDVQLAAASKATIIGFHAATESHAEYLIKQLHVTIRLHDIIYSAIDDVRKMMLELLDKIAQENDTGTALVKATFKSSHLGVIAGCVITDGIIKRNSHVRVLRGEQPVWKGSIHSLKRLKEDVREVGKGIECGILLQGFNEVKEGDILQAYEITYLQQELE